MSTYTASAYDNWLSQGNPADDPEAHRRDVLEDRVYSRTNEILEDEARLTDALNAFYGQSDVHDLVAAWYGTWAKVEACNSEEAALADGIQEAARWVAEQQVGEGSHD